MDFIDNHFDCYFNGTKVPFFLPICLYFHFVDTWRDEIVLLCKQTDHKFLKWKFLKENYYEPFSESHFMNSKYQRRRWKKIIYICIECLRIRRLSALTTEIFMFDFFFHWWAHHPCRYTNEALNMTLNRKPFDFTSDIQLQKLHIANTRCELINENTHIKHLFFFFKSQTGEKVIVNVFRWMTFLKYLYILHNSCENDVNQVQNAHNFPNVI